MAKAKKEHYQCQSCQSMFPKWLGQCSTCKSWHSIELIKAQDSTDSIARLSFSDNTMAQTSKLSPLSLEESLKDSQNAQPFKTIDEFDRVLGQGLCPGSVTLISGDPGVGKSTLLLQVLNAVQTHKEQSLLYISGEESVRQVAQRAKRLNINNPNIALLHHNHAEDIILHLRQRQSQVVIIDSIQTIYLPQSSSMMSQNQIRQVTELLVDTAKQLNITLLIIGHITKSGQIAGPKTLEHAVDTVLYLEGDQDNSIRTLRAIKNRFGSTEEVGLFDMQETGFEAVQHASTYFFDPANNANQTGSCIYPSVQGSRIVFVEVQALVSQSYLPVPIRNSVGIDPKRLNMLLAVMEKHLGIKMYQNNVHVNAVGGIKINEPAADLAICYAILSSYYNVPVSQCDVLFAEIGLSGELRSGVKTKQRLKEAAKNGFQKAVFSHSSQNKNKNKTQKSSSPQDQGFKLHALKNIHHLKHLIESHVN